MRFNVFLLAILLVPSLIFAQDRQNATTLHLKASVTTPFTGPVFNKVACDSAGNFYVRRVSGDPSLLGRQPLLRINPGGTLTGSFKLAAVSADLTFNDFFVGWDGDVYALALSVERVHTGGRVYVARFAGDGSWKSTTQIDSAEPFSPVVMAVFKSGEILLSGLQGTGLHTPFTGVFSPSGKLVRRIFEPEDEDLRQRAELGDKRVLSVSAGGARNTAVDFGGAVLASDGNVYLMRDTSPALIYVISSAGDVLRKFYVDPGDSSLSPGNIQSAPGGKLAVFLERDGGGGVAAVIDLKGNPTATYVVTPDVPLGSFACYTPPTFTFVGVGASDGPLLLNNLEPK